MTPQATVFIPTFNHGALLLRSVRSAIRQSIEDIEILIVGDGVTAETRAAIGELLTSDPRVRFLDYPKVARWGEENRHRALSEAHGDIICYLPDDDLWLPDHVETMIDLLTEADFAHALSIPARPDGSFDVWTLDLALPYHQDLVLNGVVRVGMGSTAHRSDAYARLPDGWRGAPPGNAPILYFWQQILRVPGGRVTSGTQPTVIRFLTADRASWSIEERGAEMDRWVQRLSAPGGENRFRKQVLEMVVRDRARQDAKLYDSLIWRTRIRLLNFWRTRVSWTAGERFKHLPFVGRLITAAGRALFGPIAH